MTVDVEAIRAAARGFTGRFFYDPERGDLAFIAAECDERTCDCERKLNSDGEQDCSVSLADYDEEVGESMAVMLNAVRPLLAAYEQACGERDEFRAQYLEMRRAAKRVVTERRDKLMHARETSAMVALDRLVKQECETVAEIGTAAGLAKRDGDE